MRAISLILAAALAACGSGTPDHTIEETPLVEGKRIQIDVAKDITREECIALILENREKANPNGQVSVHKFNKALGRLSPWCVDNLDGEGVKFNDFGF